MAAILCTLACVACTNKARQANEYPAGTAVSVIVTELGAPDVEKPYSDALRNVAFCPSETVRLLEYHRRPLPLLRLVDHGAVAVICVDSADRVAKVLFSDS